MNPMGGWVDEDDKTVHSDQKGNNLISYFGSRLSPPPIRICLISSSTAGRSLGLNVNDRLSEDPALKNVSSP